MKGAPHMPQHQHSYSLELPNTARAYVNHGRWVADCPTACNNAWELEPQQMIAQCGNCGNLCPVRWPSDADAIWDALQVRPLPRTRNWYPRGHEFAIRAGCPHGQTVDELKTETADHLGAGTTQFWSILKDAGGEVY